MAHTQPADAERLPPYLQSLETSGTTEKIDRFLATQKLNSPCVVIDLDVVREKYFTLRAHFPDAKIFYAVKANPATDVLAALASLGANFDLASDGEIDRCRAVGIASDRFSFGNTIKRETEIGRAYRSGVSLFAFDSLAEVEKIARAAPSAQVFCRLLVGGKGAEWPLTRKFGCDAEMAARSARARSIARLASAGRVVPRRLATDRPVAMASGHRRCRRNFSRLRTARPRSRFSECRRRAAFAISHVHTAARRLR